MKSFFIALLAAAGLLLLPGHATAACGDAEADRILADLTQAAALSPSARQSIADARRLLQNSECDDLARYYAEMAVVSVYTALGDDANGVPHLEFACTLAERLPGDDRRAFAVPCLDVLFKVLTSLRRIDDALRVEERRKKVADDRGRAVIEMYQRARSATAHLFLGEYGVAVADATEAHRLLEQDALAQRTSGALLVLNARGAVHLYLNDPQRALIVFEEADRLAAGILANARGDRVDALIVHDQLATAYRGTAVALVLLRRANDAGVAIDKAIAHAREAGPNSPAAASGLQRLKAQIELDRSGSSDATRRRLLALMTETHDLAGGWLLQLSGEVDAARLSEMLRQLPQVLPLASSADRIEIHARLAAALGRRGDENGRIEHDVAAIALIEQARFEARQTEALPAFFSPHVRVYDDLIAALYAKAQRQEAVPPSLARFGRSCAEVALYFAEAAHARQFAERYGPVLIDAFGVRAGLPDDVRLRERELRQAAAKAVSPELDVFGTAASPLEVRAQRELATKTYIDFLDTIGRQYPAFAELAFPRPVVPGQLPPALDDRYIASYKITDDAIYWWVVFNNQLVASGRSGIGRPALSSQAVMFAQYLDDTSLADQLSAVLVREPFGKIADLARARGITQPRVVIVPDEATYLIPWEALTGPRGGYVLDGFVTTYAPSLTVLSQAARVVPAAAVQKAALVVGNAQGADVTIPVDAVPSLFKRLQNDETARVVAALRQRGYRTSLLSGPGVTPATLPTQPTASYELLHFDTHAFANSVEPPPSMVLGPSPASPFGLFKLDDIAKLHLQARLVVLSACESALGTKGDPRAGEGVESLARSFMLAGSKAVLASLWLVDSADTAVLMETFYRELGPNNSDDGAALFRAKTTLRRSGWSVPSRWARFILIE